MARSSFQSKYSGSRPAPGGNDYGAAAATTLASNFNSARASAPKFDEIAGLGIKTNSEERQQAMASEAAVMGAGVTSIGNTQSAMMQAEGNIKSAEVQAAAETQSAAMGAFATVAKAGIGAIALSDERTKHTINDIEQATSLLRDLRPVTFYYKEEYADEPKRKHYGFIAQEYERLMPDATYTLGDDGMKGINMQELIALLVSSNQELESRIRRLEVKEALKPVVAGVR